MHSLNYLSRRESSDNEFVTVEMCFDALSPEQQLLVDKSTTILEFKSHETIIKQGFVADHIMLIESGVARLDVTNDGKISTVALLSEGSFVGIMCSFACKNMDFSSVALEKTVVRLINMDVFQQLIRENGEFALKMIRHMSGMTNRMVHWITRISDKNVDGALALMMNEFHRVYSSDEFKLPVSRVELAEMCGFSKESVINSLRSMHENGLLYVDGKKVRILEPDRLKIIAVNA